MRSQHGCALQCGKTVGPIVQSYMQYSLGHRLVHIAWQHARHSGARVQPRAANAVHSTMQSGLQYSWAHSAIHKTVESTIAAQSTIQSGVQHSLVYIAMQYSVKCSAVFCTMQLHIQYSAVTYSVEYTSVCSRVQSTGSTPLPALPLQRSMQIFPLNQGYWQAEHG